MKIIIYYTDNNIDNERAFTWDWSKKEFVRLNEQIFSFTDVMNFCET